MGALIRMPLRVLLPCLAVSLVAFGAVAAGLAGAPGASGYLMRQADSNLLACASSMLSHGFVAAPDSSPVPPVPCDMELLSASRQVLTLAAPGTAYGPAIPAGGAWLAAHLARPVTVPGTETSRRWRVVIEAVRYRAQRILYVYGPDDVRYIINRRPGPGSGGVLVVMTGLASTGRLAAGYAAAAGAVLVLLAGAVLALTRAILRPLRQAAELAESAGPSAGGKPSDGMPRRGLWAGTDGSRWPLGMTLGMTFARMREQLCASRAAEAAARRSADEMSRHLGETALELLRSVNVVRGFTEYYRQQPKPSAARLDRMLQRVADEAAQMETLIEELQAPLLGSAVPGSRATRHTAGANPASRDAQ
jgi:signal transduction histidine kinase